MLRTNKGNKPPIIPQKGPGFRAGHPVVGQGPLPLPQQLPLHGAEAPAPPEERAEIFRKHVATFFRSEKNWRNPLPRIIIFAWFARKECTCTTPPERGGHATKVLPVVNYLLLTAVVQLEELGMVCHLSHFSFVISTK